MWLNDHENVRYGPALRIVASAVENATVISYCVPLLRVSPVRIKDQAEKRG